MCMMKRLMILAAMQMILCRSLCVEPSILVVRYGTNVVLIICSSVPVLPSGMARPLFQLARRLVQAPSIHRSFLLARPGLFQRQFRHSNIFSNKSIKPTPTPPPPPPATPPPPSPEPTLAQQRKSDWAIIKRLLENVWPRGDWKTRGTVLFSFGLLVGSKVCQYFTTWKQR
jgi:hypothetical protein